MRLWHYKLIEYLPDKQLLSQWRELNAIYRKQQKHILINYVYHYKKKDLWVYSNMIIEEMIKRGYQIKSFENYEEYFEDFKTEPYEDYKPFKLHHNEDYLKICCWNLYEKYIRGQKDFDIKTIQFIESVIK